MDINIPGTPEKAAGFPGPPRPAMSQLPFPSCPLWITPRCTWESEHRVAFPNLRLGTPWPSSPLAPTLLQEPRSDHSVFFQVRPS